jgi:hypothetical protein
MKERDTVILPVRIKKILLTEINEKVCTSRQKSRNAWVIWAITQGLRKHGNHQEKHNPIIDIVRKANQGIDK